MFSKEESFLSENVHIYFYKSTSLLCLVSTLGIFLALKRKIFWQLWSHKILDFWNRKSKWLFVWRGRATDFQFPVYILVFWTDFTPEHIFTFLFACFYLNILTFLLGDLLALLLRHVKTNLVKLKLNFVEPTIGKKCAVLQNIFYLSWHIFTDICWDSFRHLVAYLFWHSFAFFIWDLEQYRLIETSNKKVF